MKKTQRSHGKISEHFQGLGTVTSDLVVQRAREIALINGRQPNHYTQDDFAEAKRELTGAAAPSEGDEEEDAVAGLVTWDEAPDAAGHPSAREQAEDEQDCAAQLIDEGVEEAEHEQMVEGSRNPHNQE